MNYLKCVLFLSFISCLSLQAKDVSFEKAVRQAVEEQVKIYPASTLKDLYKNFFQDKFGPGHLVADTTASANYLRRELSEMTASSGKIAETTGWEGNFYRVNLSVLKDGLISWPLFFDAFVRSVNGIEPPSIQEWQEEWSRIESVIASMNLSLPEYDTDKKEIEARFERGEYVGHHSEIFEENYAPHYRIFSRDIYEQELLPYLSE